MKNVKKIIQAAINLHRSGDLKEAEKLYRLIIKKR